MNNFVAKPTNYEHGFHPRSEATKVHSLSAEIKTNTDLIPDSDEEQVEEQQQPRRSVRQKAKPKILNISKCMKEKKNHSLILNLRNL